MDSTREPARGRDARDAKAGKETVRRHNLSLVLRAVHEEGEATRAAVAARVGLTRAAVSSLVEQLLAGGFLTERGKTFSGHAGRPGTALRVADTGPAGLGVEINVDYVSACVVDLAGADRVRLTEEVDNQDARPEEVLARAARIAARALDAAAGKGLDAAGAGLALPGLVSGGTVRQAPNLGWNRVDAGRLFAEALRAAAPGRGGPAVTVDNEANAAALAELWFGGPADAPRLRGFVYLTGEIGVGGALVLDGALLRGAHGFAGEIGHLVVDPDGPRCRCGSHGCLEQYAGQAALLRGAGVAESAGARGVAELKARARRGEPRAVAALERAGRMLGLAVSAAVNLLDPDAVVLGGVFRPLMEWLGPAAERELAARVVSGLWAVGSGRLRASSSSGDAARGAAALVVRGVLADPAGHAPPPAPGARVVSSG
ncbi:ROK family protein [Streptomyces sp. ODS05-4]|uniref:ROK family protein n=1 Tax=Streptomyces sp. ODS05-4 TaxID=2944939 RepID=UPI00210B5FC6|nr:ROK family protein [Streptomyces sp. ODS05-4]